METTVNGVLLVIVFAVYYAGTETVIGWVKGKHWRRPHLPRFFPLRLGLGFARFKKSRRNRQNSPQPHCRTSIEASAAEANVFQNPAPMRRKLWSIIHSTFRSKCAI